MIQKLKKRKITFLGRPISVIAIALLLAVGLASAALLSYYGMITGTAVVHQSVKLDGTECTGGDMTKCTVSDEMGELAPGGEKFCYKHTLKNDASVDATVDFELTKCTPDCGGITTKYYELLGWSDIIEVGREDYAGTEVDLDNPEDPYATLGNILIEASIEDGAEGWVVFTVTTPAGLIGSTPETYSGSVVFILDEDADGTTDWQVSYEPGSLMFDFDGVWGYEEALETGVNPEPRAFEDATLRDDIQVERDGDKFILKVRFNKLGGCDGSYKFGLYISHLTEYWGGIEGGAGQVMMFYPVFENFDWADMSSYPTRTLGTEITGNLELESGEEKHFCNCYDFAINIVPDTYTITTGITPVTGAGPGGGPGEPA